MAAEIGKDLVEPVIMAKIGDGTKNFANLPWSFYAKASDVLSVCKNEDDLATFINDKVDLSGIVVGNGTISVTQNGVSKGSFTLNQSGGATIALTDTTYAVFSTSKDGLVPKASASGDVNKFLKGDGTWATPYTHPSHTAAGEGLYKVTVDAKGHVTKTTAVAKSDITALGIPEEDTHYTTHLYAGSGSAANATTTNGNTKITVADNATAGDSITIKGINGTTVTSEGGVISVSSAVVDSSLSASSTNPVQNKVVNTALAGKVPTARTINNKALSSDITLTAADVTADPAGSAATALNDAKTYADGIKNDLLNGAGTAYDTLKELGDLIDDNTDAIGALEEVAGSKVDATDFEAHTDNTTVHITAAERTAWTAAKTHADSAHAPADAEANQNAFSNVKVGSVTVAADSETDTLELVAGSNVTITPDATNDKITISATDSHYASKNIVGTSNTATSDGAVTENGVFLNHLEESTLKSTHKITGAGGTKVTSDANGNITITSTDNNTWKANSSTVDGYVTKTGGADNAGKAWMVGESGEPAWIDPFEGTFIIDCGNASE